MVIELLFLNGYGYFVWPAFVFTFGSLLYLYLSTKKELQKQEKIFFNEFKNLYSTKIEISKKKIYKAAWSNRSI
tara:strand:+ start:179 stop:400 length:222 start_codon:yes stop_codon:yes gene_type:complete